MGSFQSVFMLNFSIVDPVIAVRIVRNPKKAVLTEKVLKSEFGTDSKFSNKLQVLNLDQNVGAVLQMENSAGK